MTDRDPRPRNPETLAERLIREWRIAFDNLHDISSHLTTLRAQQSEKSEQLDALIVVLAKDHPDEPANILMAKLPKEVKDSAISWFGEELDIRILRAAYKEYSKQQTEIFNALLVGKEITATSLDGRNFSTANGVVESMLVGGGGITEVTDTYLGIQVETGRLYLGEATDHVIIPVFDTLTREQRAEIIIGSNKPKD